MDCRRQSLRLQREAIGLALPPLLDLCWGGGEGILFGGCSLTRCEPVGPLAVARGHPDGLLLRETPPTRTPSPPPRSASQTRQREALHPGRRRSGLSTTAHEPAPSFARPAGARGGGCSLPARGESEGYLHKRVSRATKETQRLPRGAGSRALWGSARASVLALQVPLRRTDDDAADARQLQLGVSGESKKERRLVSAVRRSTWLRR